MRILQLSTHSTLRPRHGGKLRSHHIGRVIEESGFDLRRLAFCARTEDDVDDPREPIVDVASAPFWSSDRYRAYGPAAAYVGDYLSTEAALCSPDLLDAFDHAFEDAAPDLVLLEHPWTWPLIARHPEVQARRIRVVYSSQNVELNLKRDILKRVAAPPAPRLLDGIGELERGLVRHADAVVACTKADADVFSGWGARRVLVAPNGGVKRDRSHLRSILPAPIEPHHAYALVVGSAHPPNISGFLELVAPWLPRLRPFERVVVAGGASQAIGAELARMGIEPMLRDRLVLLGVLDDLTLDCVLANTQVLLVPITYGGGSNVKTAEALLSERPVVATSAALRGFDTASGVPGLSVADTPESFGAAVLGLLEKPQPGVPGSHPAVSALLWDVTIGPLVAFLRETAAEPLRQLLGDGHSAGARAGDGLSRD